ncbi:unnamed protein product [Paramecium sonneborni]|uniref:Uncharacterized protein n=1 Tax=Paramecium sonneborni TaxID=65129 RepID=A0A8S1M221_9CILI|nr:unnamed protein product [Paramecium sonneborni]
MMVPMKLKLIQQDFFCAIELPTDTIVEDVITYAQNIFNTDLKNQQWTCYSEIRACFLDSYQEVGYFPNDTLTLDFKHQNQFLQNSIVYQSLKNSQIYFQSQINTTSTMSIMDEIKNSSEQIVISVYFCQHTIQLQVSEDLTICEILEFLLLIQKQQINKFSVKDNLDEFRCYSQARNCFLNLDQKLGFYPDDELIFSQKQQRSEFLFSSDDQDLQLQYIQFKIDQGDLNQIHVNAQTKIIALLVQIQNQQNLNGNIQEWTCYSEKRCCFLDLNENFGHNSNDILSISTQNRVKCYQLSKCLEQMKKQINKRFEQIRQNYLQELEEKEKQLTDLLFKDHKEIFQMAFSPVTLESTYKLNQFIETKNKNNHWIIDQIQKLEEFSEIEMLQLKTIYNKNDQNQYFNLLVEKSTTPKELYEYLEENFFLNKPQQTKSDNISWFISKYNKVNDINSSLNVELQAGDFLFIGPYILEISQCFNNNYLMKIPKPQIIARKQNLQQIN